MANLLKANNLSKKTEAVRNSYERTKLFIYHKTYILRGQLAQSF